MRVMSRSLVVPAIAILWWILVLPAMAANETISLVDWPSGWQSNDKSPQNLYPNGVVSYNPEFGTIAYYSSVEEYVKGVLAKELEYWADETVFIKGYKAFAIAARNILLFNHAKNSSIGYDIKNWENAQTDIAICIINAMPCSLTPGS